MDISIPYENKDSLARRHKEKCQKCLCLSEAARELTGATEFSTLALRALFKFEPEQEITPLLYGTREDNTTAKLTRNINQYEYSMLMKRARFGSVRWGVPTFSNSSRECQDTGFDQHMRNALMYKNAERRLKGEPITGPVRPPTVDPRNAMAKAIKAPVVVERASQCSLDPRAKIICRESLSHLTRIKEPLYIKSNILPSIMTMAWQLARNVRRSGASSEMSTEIKENEVGEKGRRLMVLLPESVVNDHCPLAGV
ncbi:hypothetical protein M514_24062 [Trichuris suis]|uniref:Uncharacterized protein n=1 Tax=Trichuris suis TaxID=68888 RepID=A0A085N2L3_9BILA|nr:hypothetical protein M514_24062 [Trichuris suis]